MRVCKISEEAYAKNPKTVQESRAYAEEIQKEMNTPIELSGARVVEYDQKTDRYSVTFSSTDRKTKLKATNKVAEFVTAHINDYGLWRGRMENGVLVDVNLIQI